MPNANSNQQQPVPQEQLKERAFETLRDALRLLAVGFEVPRVELLTRIERYIKEVYRYGTK